MKDKKFWINLLQEELNNAITSEEKYKCLLGIYHLQGSIQDGYPDLVKYMAKCRKEAGASETELHHQEIFKQFMVYTKQFLNQKGYSKKNNNFYKRHPQGNIGVINFQKSTSIGRFTINYGIYSPFTVKVFEPGKIKKYPSVCECDWYQRIELPSQYKSKFIHKNSFPDPWWIFYEDFDIPALAEEICSCLSNYVLPKRACKPFCVNAVSGESALEFDSESIHSGSPIM
jgi:hypothetical protein